MGTITYHCSVCGAEAIQAAEAAYCAEHPSAGVDSVVSGQYALARDTYSTGLHGVTGRPTEEGTLAAGTLVRDVRTFVDQHDLATATEFSASTDGGKTWYRQRAEGRIEMARAEVR